MSFEDLDLEDKKDLTEAKRTIDAALANKSSPEKKRLQLHNKVLEDLLESEDKRDLREVNRTKDAASTKSPVKRRLIQNKVLDDLLGLEEGEGTLSQGKSDICYICQKRLTSKSELLKHYEAHQKGKSISNLTTETERCFLNAICVILLAVAVAIREAFTRKERK